MEIFQNFPPIRFFKSTGLKNVGNMSLIVPFVKDVLGELGMGDAGADEEEARGGSGGHFFFLFLFFEVE